MLFELFKGKMDITEISIMHHVSIVFFALWLLSVFNWSHPVSYLVSFVYLFLVHEKYIVRLRRKLQFDERKQANQRRVLSDSETVRWLNHAVEKMWPMCMENITSQKILLAIVPWFLEKYKPWTAKEAVVQHMYLGRNPPMFTQIRVLNQCPPSDDHLVLELGMNFCTADDMSTILAVKLRKRLGFGMWAKLHITGMHIEGKVLVGVKFLRRWPFIGRLRVCFAEPPYFQMTVKPIFTHGLDVTVLPGIAGWLDKLLSVAFEQTLVQPNMLVVDVEKFASPRAESWFSVDEKEPIAFIKVEVIEGSDMKPSDLNGLADPYVKGRLGPYRFRTKTQKKTLAPKWQEEFKIPICSWDSPNVLAIEVRDKDHFVDDTLGECTININDLRDCDRHDMWLPLQNIKMGRVHIAITVMDESLKDVHVSFGEEALTNEDIQDSHVDDMVGRTSVSSISAGKPQKVLDNFEPIKIEGQEQTGMWVHQPGSEVLQTWTPRKGKTRRLDNDVQSARSDNASGPLDSSSSDEPGQIKIPTSRVRRGLHKIGSVFHRGQKKDANLGNGVENVESPYANIKAVDQKAIGVKLVVDENVSLPSSGKDVNAMLSPEGSDDSPNMKGMAKSILKHAGKSARSLKHALSRKGSNRSQGDSSIGSEQAILESGSSDDESVSSPHDLKIPAVSNPTSHQSDANDSRTPTETTVNETATSTNSETEKGCTEGQHKIADNELSSSKELGVGLEEFSNLQPTAENPELKQK